MCMTALPAIFVCASCICLVPEEDIRNPGTGGSDNFELPCGCLELNLGFLEEQEALKTAKATVKSPETILNAI